MQEGNEISIIFHICMISCCISCLKQAVQSRTVLHLVPRATNVTHAAFQALDYSS